MGLGNDKRRLDDKTRGDEAVTGTEVRKCQPPPSFSRFTLPIFNSFHHRLCNHDPDITLCPISPILPVAATGGKLSRTGEEFATDE